MRDCIRTEHEKMMKACNLSITFLRLLGIAKIPTAEVDRKIPRLQHRKYSMYYRPRPVKHTLIFTPFPSIFVKFLRTHLLRGERPLPGTPEV